MKTYSQFTRKNVGAFFIGPLAIIPTVFILLGIEAAFKHQTSSTMWMGLFPFFTALGLAISYLATLTLGLPAVIILKKYDRLTLVNLLLVGVASVTVATLLISPTIYFWLFFASCSSSVIVGAWYVHKYIQ